MKNTQKLFALALFSSALSTAYAAPMPHTIVVEDKAVVPVVKTEIIRTIKGQAPVREVNATVLEMTNKGKDIVARDIVFNDNQAQFTEGHMAIPVLKKGGVIVPTSKIEVNSKIKQGNDVIVQGKTIDAAGVEFKKGEAPTKRSLQLDQVKDPNADTSATRAVVKENDVTTRDVIVVEEDQ